MQNVANSGETLKARREALGLSAEELGALVGLTGTTIRRYEAGEQNLPTTVAKIEKALDDYSANQPETVRAELQSMRRELAELRALLEGIAGRLSPPPGPH